MLLPGAATRALPLHPPTSPRARKPTEPILRGWTLARFSPCWLARFIHYRLARVEQALIGSLTFSTTGSESLPSVPHDMAARIVIDLTLDGPPDDAHRSSFRECISCTNRKRVTAFPAIDRCRHPRHMCRACLRQWVGSKVHAQGRETHLDAPVPCPECGEHMRAPEVRRFLTRELFDRYDADAGV